MFTFSRNSNKMAAINNYWIQKMTNLTKILSLLSAISSDTSEWLFYIKPKKYAAILQYMCLYMNSPEVSM